MQQQTRASDTFAKSAVQWSPPLSEPFQPSAELAKAVRRVTMRKEISRRMGSTLDCKYNEWGDKPDVRRNLFLTDPSGHTLPRHKLDILEWKGIIHNYCEWHEISNLDDIVDLWCSLVDVFISYPDFESPTNTYFRAWLYGCMCKFILEQRKQRQTKQTPLHSGEYDPDHPHY